MEIQDDENGLHVSLDSIVIYVPVRIFSWRSEGMKEKPKKSTFRRNFPIHF